MLPNRPITPGMILLAMALLAISIHHFFAGVYALLTGQTIAVTAGPPHYIPLSGIEAVGIGMAGICVFLLLPAWAILTKNAESS